MTIIEQIKAEIERRIALYSSLSENTVNPNRIDEDRQILSFISTLESEKPMNQETREKDFDNECHRYFNGMTPEQFLNTPNTVIARHFAEWGAEHAKKEELPVSDNLEEAAEEYLQKVKAGFLRTLEHPTAKDCFKDGAKWDREQMLSDAVEADVNIYRDLVAGKSWAEFVVEMPTSDLGDKVRIIILPKEAEQ